MNFKENYDASFMVGYKKGYEEAIYLFHEWLKNQSIVGFDYEHCDLLIIHDGRWVSAMDVYLRKIGDENEKTDKGENTETAEK